jgi:hypothetical protein
LSTLAVSSSELFLLSVVEWPSSDA